LQPVPCACYRCRNSHRKFWYCWNPVALTLPRQIALDLSTLAPTIYPAPHTKEGK